MILQNIDENYVFIIFGLSADIGVNLAEVTESIPSYLELGRSCQAVYYFCNFTLCVVSTLVFYFKISVLALSQSASVAIVANEYSPAITSDDINRC